MRSWEKHAKGTKLRASAKNKEEGKGGDSFSSHPFPLLAHPLPTSPQFLLTSGALFRSPACSLTRSIPTREKGKETAATQAALSFLTSQSELAIYFMISITRDDVIRPRLWSCHSFWKKCRLPRILLNRSFFPGYFLFRLKSLLL